MHVLLQTDNTTIIRYVNKFGGTHSLPLRLLSTQLLEYSMQHHITLTAEYIPGKENITADSLSRQSNPVPARMAPLPEDIQQDPSAHSDTTQSGSIRLTYEQPAAEVCELAARPGGHGGERLCTGMGKHGEQYMLTRPWWPVLLESLIQPPLLLRQSQSLLTNPMGDSHPLSNLL